MLTLEAVAGQLTEGPLFPVGVVLQLIVIQVWIGSRWLGVRKKNWIMLLALQALAGQLSPSEYRGAAVPGGVGAALGIWAWVERQRYAMRCR